jgi:DNA-binding transcriptional LysR family regulator
MELQQIKYFLAIVDFGTFMAAAEHVHVSQPTLSAGIRKLEQSVDAQLFNRGSRSATLTSAGELFLNTVRPAYNQLLSAKSKLLDEQKKINLGILNSIPMDHISEIIRTYRITNPHVFVDVFVGNDEALFSMLKTRKLDMAFTNNQRDPENFTLLFNEKLMIAASTQHPFSLSKEIELKQFDQQPFIERTKCESWGNVHNEFQKQHINPITVCRAESDDSVLSLVAANLGISIMPVRNTPYDVTFVPIKDLNIIRHIGVVVSSKNLAQHVQVFYETVLKKFNVMS